MNTYLALYLISIPLWFILIFYINRKVCRDLKFDFDGSSTGKEKTSKKLFYLSIIILFWPVVFVWFLLFISLHLIIDSTRSTNN